MAATIPRSVICWTCQRFLVGQFGIAWDDNAGRGGTRVAAAAADRKAADVGESADDAGGEQQHPARADRRGQTRLILGCIAVNG